MIHWGRKRFLLAVISIAILAHCATAKKPQASEIQPEEYRGHFLDETRSLARSKATCDKGWFFSLWSEDCKKCDDHCPNGTDITLCGEECIGYFYKKETAEENQKRDETIAELQYKLQQHIMAITDQKQIYWIAIPVSIFLSVAISVITTVCVLKSYPHIHTIPVQDPHNNQYQLCFGFPVDPTTIQAQPRITHPTQEGNSRGENVTIVMDNVEGHPVK